MQDRAAARMGHMISAWRRSIPGYLDYFAAEYMEGALDPLHPVDSLRFAARYLRALYDRLGSWEAAVVAYKTGPEKVSQAPVWLRKLARKVVEG